MKTIEFNEYLVRNNIEVFSINEAARIIGKAKNYTSLFLFRNKKIKLAEKGLYYRKDANEYAVATRVVYPSYVSLVSALRLHNITEQIPNIIYVVSSKRHRKIKSLNGYGVEFRTVKKKLMYGYRKIDNIFVADVEKAVVDMLYLNSFVEYAEEAVLNNSVDTKKLLHYAKLSKVNAIIKKVSYWIDSESKVIK